MEDGRKGRMEDGRMEGGRDGWKMEEREGWKMEGYKYLVPCLNEGFQDFKICRISDRKSPYTKNKN